MKQDKWTQQLHDKLAEHQTEAPADLWADIEAALPPQLSPDSGLHRQVVQPRKPRFATLRRWAAAAAVAALLGGGSLVWLAQQDRQLLSASAESEAAYPTCNDEEAGVDEGGGSSPDNLIAQAVAPQTVRQDKPQPLRQEKPQTDDKSTDGDKPSAAATTPASTDRPTADEQRPATVETGERPFTPAPPRRRNNNRKPTLSLYAMNGLGTKDNSNAVIMADALAQKYATTDAAGQTAAARRQTPIYLTGYEEYQYHRQPIAFGLTVDYPLTRQLSLTTGIVYTKLYSEFTQTIRSQTISKEQQLHYLGLPLSLNYRLWQHKNFRAYVSVGMQADWNINASMKAEGVKQEMSRDRLQWSANGSVGLQYNLLPQLGIYAEPGINHYFDNGSNIQNYFKDKPTSLKLQIGIRLTPHFR